MFVKLEADGVKKLEDVSIDLDKVNVLIGPNGQGKTSVIDALKFAISPQSEDIISNSKGVAKVVVHADSGTVIRRTMKAGKKGASSLTVKPKGKPPYASPQTLLNSIFPVMGLDPTSICTGSKDAKSQKKIIYKITEDSASLEPEEIESLHSGGMKGGETAKAFLDRVYKEVYSDRAKANAAIKKLEVLKGQETGKTVDVGELKKKQMALTSEISKLESDLAEAEAYNQATEMVSRLEGRIEGLAEAEEQLAGLKSQIDSYQKDSGNTDKLQEKLEKAISELGKAKSFVAIWGVKVEDMERTIELGKNKKCPLFDSISKDVNCPADLSKEFAELTTEMESDKKKVKAEKAKVTRLQKKVKGIEKEIESASNDGAAEVAKLWEQYSELKKKVETQRADAETLEMYQATIDKLGKSHDGKEMPDAETIEAMKAENRELSYRIRSAEDNSLSNIEKELAKSETQKEKDEAILKKIKVLQEKVSGMVSLPKGVEMTPSGLTYKGVSLGALSEKEKFVVAIRIVKNLYPKSKLICIDGFETFSKDIRGHLLTRMASDDYQYFVTVVGPQMTAGESPEVYLKENLGANFPSFYVENGKFTKIGG